jgi:hypothetical protein
MRSGIALSFAAESSSRLGLKGRFMLRASGK